MCSGCVESDVENRLMEWSGVLLKSDVRSSVSTVTLDTGHGVKTKVWHFSYPVLESLDMNSSYVFVSSVKYKFGTARTLPQLVEIRDEMNMTIWKS